MCYVLRLCAKCQVNTNRKRQENVSEEKESPRSPLAFETMPVLLDRP
jgi:hypothetical protein